MPTFASRLQEALDMRNLTPAELSKITGIGEGAISQYRKGVYKATQRNLEKIATALQVPIPWLMGLTDTLLSSSLPPNILPLPKMVKKPRLGTIACGKPILAVEDAEEFDSVPVDADCDFTLKCKGDSMINARIFDGDIVYIRKQPEVELGQIAAVRIGDEATLKKVYYTPGSGRMILRACNPLYGDLTYEGEELNQVEIMGLAVGFFSLVRHEQ